MSESETLIMISGILVSVIVGIISYVTGYTRGYNTCMDEERRVAKAMAKSEGQEKK